MSALAMSGNSFRAEWLKLWRRPATWILGLILLAVILSLGYVLLYVISLIVERTAATQQNPDPAGSARSLRETLPPASLVAQVLPLLSGLGGPIGLILGALAVGSEYGWGTLKTIFTQRPGRLSIFAGKVGALALIVLLFSAGALAVGLLGSLVCGALAGASLAPPSAATIVRGLGAAWLILATWTALGILLATLFRGTALAIGLGLVYALVLETIVGTATALVERIRPIRQAFLGANTGDLANAFARPTPGGFVPSSRIPPEQATLVLLAYIALFLALAALVLRRRDVA